MTGRSTARIVLGSVVMLLALAAAPGVRSQDADIPNLVGTWIGENRTLSEAKGYRIWGKKTIEITEQQDRRFRGHFTYADGTKHFMGVIYPDNTSITWVASDSKGYNHGRILGPDTISACYVESGSEATVGCATLERQK